jgi:hypothetical protein
MTQKELSIKLDLHKKWLNDDEDGACLNLTMANLIGANLIGANLVGANLSGADLTRANLINADLTRADLTRANLTMANLIGANLIGANLIGANLVGAKLIGADLTNADLTGANLSGADLTNADLTGADLYIACGDNTRGIYIQIFCSSKCRLVKYQDNIQIGCEKHSVQHWLDNYKEIGAKAGYSEKEIKQYGNVIKLLAHSSFN